MLCFIFCYYCLAANKRELLLYVLPTSVFAVAQENDQSVRIADSSHRGSNRK